MNADVHFIRRRRLSASALVGASAALLTAACHRPPATPPDALRGIVKTVGTARVSELVLQRTTPDNALVSLRAAAPDAAALARVAGTVVAVRGEFRGADTLIVSSFRVVEVDGQQVIDGVVRQENAHLSVCPPSSACVALGNPPDALRTLVGARVWFGGPPATGPNTFGVIAPR